MTKQILLGQTKSIDKTCSGKIKHKSLLAAEYILSQMRGKDSHLLEVYKCPFCRGFHIGHNKKKDGNSKNKSLEKQGGAKAAV